MEAGEALALLVPALVSLLGAFTWGIKKVIGILEEQLESTNRILERTTEKYGEVVLEIRESNRLQKEAIERIDRHVQNNDIHVQGTDRVALDVLKG